jgi:hypothetical protein
VIRALDCASRVQDNDALPGFDAFFAENVQDLNGLDANILSALRECAALIGNAPFTRLWILSLSSFFGFFSESQPNAMPCACLKVRRVFR